MADDTRIASAVLSAPDHAIDALADFYAASLGITAERDADGTLALVIGAATLALRPAEKPAEPFHHFALLVPGDRFGAAREWLAAATPLLIRPDDDETVFPFPAWEAQACYAHDPAGNIVELIAHRGIGERGTGRGQFRATELIAISEVGLVCDSPASAAGALEAAGLPLWFGSVDDPGRALGFVGRQAHTLILVAPGRPWLPTGRPAEPHPAEVVIATGGRELTVAIPTEGAAVDVGPR